VSPLRDDQIVWILLALAVVGVVALIYVLAG
jgi:hypothetical protein